MKILLRSTVLAVAIGAMTVTVMSITIPGIGSALTYGASNQPHPGDDGKPPLKFENQALYKGYTKNADGIIVMYSKPYDDPTTKQLKLCESYEIYVGDEIQPSIEIMDTLDTKANPFVMLMRYSDDRACIEFINFSHLTLLNPKPLEAKLVNNFLWSSTRHTIEVAVTKEGKPANGIVDELLASNAGEPSFYLKPRGGEVLFHDYAGTDKNGIARFRLPKLGTGFSSFTFEAKEYDEYKDVAAKSERQGKTYFNLGVAYMNLASSIGLVFLLVLLSIPVAAFVRLKKSWKR